MFEIITRKRGPLVLIVVNSCRAVTKCITYEINDVSWAVARCLVQQLEISLGVLSGKRCSRGDWGLQKSLREDAPGPGSQGRPELGRRQPPSREVPGPAGRAQPGGQHGGGVASRIAGEWVSTGNPVLLRPRLVGSLSRSPSSSVGLQEARSRQRPVRPGLVASGHLQMSARSLWGPSRSCGSAQPTSLRSQHARAAPGGAEDRAPLCSA